MTKIRNHIVVPIALSIMLIISSWNNGLDSVVGPIQQRTSYDNPSMWYIQNRGGEADLFYIISTETGDHMMGGDTCHLADIYNMELRKPMQKEMTAVDSFYSIDRHNDPDYIAAASAAPNSEHLTSLAPSIWRAKS